MARKGGNPNPLTIRVCERITLSKLGLNEGDDAPLPEWAVRLLMAKGVSKRNKTALLIAHNRRIHNYRSQQLATTR